MSRRRRKKTAGLTQEHVPSPHPSKRGESERQLALAFAQRGGPKGCKSCHETLSASDARRRSGTVRRVPSIHSTLAHPRPTSVFDTYWRFAAERQETFFRRFRQASPPWSSDPILQRYKFTNAYRASDRVSQYLIRHVIYTGDQSPREICFRTLVFKVFNRIETWQRLTSALGGVRWDTFCFEHYDRVLTDAIDSGVRIYSAAYIMPSGCRGSGEARKHRMHLRLIARMMDENVAERIATAPHMKAVFGLLHSYPSIGSFLAYQYATDLNYSVLTDFAETDFVVPGPGARDGIRKCFASLGDFTESDLIRYVTDKQEEEFARLGLNFRSLWGRPLQYIDCQNLFCEVDKYARVFHPEASGLSGRTRIKQQFQPTARPLEYWYPPKWRLNERIAAEVTQEPAAGDDSSSHARWDLWTAAPPGREGRD